MFAPASSQNSRDSIVVVVVLGARVPGQALLIELRVEIAFNHFQIQKDHLYDSLRNASVCLLGWHKVRFVASLPLQNIIYSSPH